MSQAPSKKQIALALRAQYSGRVEQQAKLTIRGEQTAQKTEDMLRHADTMAQNMKRDAEKSENNKVKKNKSGLIC